MAGPYYLEDILMAFNTDFDGIVFNDGTGYEYLEGIHLGIKERAEVTGHAAIQSEYSDVFLDSPVWHQSPGPTDPSVSRVFLKDVLSNFYDSIEDLVEGQPRLEWTETEGRSDVWDMVSLNADIGLGDFKTELLTKAQNYLPFLWLHKALNRLIYHKATAQGIPGTTLTDSDSQTGIGINSTLQSTWTQMLANPVNSFPGNGRYLQMSGKYTDNFPDEHLTQLRYNCSNIPVAFFPVVSGGTINDVDFNFWYSQVGYNPNSFIVDVMGTLKSFLTADGGPAATTVYVEGNAEDIDLTGATTYLAFDWHTAIPATVPFGPIATVGAAEYLKFEYKSTAAYINISSQLTDQN